MQVGEPQGSVLSPTLHNLYINDTPQTICVNLTLFADDTCLYATERKEGYVLRKTTERKEGYVLRKVQRGLNSMSTWIEHWNIKIIEYKTQAIYFSNQRRQPGSILTLNELNIPFVSNVKYLRVIFDERMIWRLHIETIHSKAFRTFIRLYSLFKRERLNS
jgi:hypothetical protein